MVEKSMNRSKKQVLSARVSHLTAELLNAIREDSNLSVPAILESALLSIADESQQAKAHARAAQAESQSRINAAAGKMKAAGLSKDELRIAVEIAASDSGPDGT